MKLEPIPGRHVHAGNCSCPACWRKDEDVCVEHEEPRGECDHCPRCPACDAAVSGGVASRGTDLTNSEGETLAERLRRDRGTERTRLHLLNPALDTVRQIVPVYWEIRLPVTAPGHAATYRAKGPTRFTRIVGNVLTDGVELTSLKVAGREQLADPPLDLSFLPATNENTLSIETAAAGGAVTLDVFIRRRVPARALLIGPTYNGEHRHYKLAKKRASNEYVVMVEGVTAVI